MQRLGFANNWIKFIMACVSSVSYSVLINGNLVGNINPLRGLQQGDPISPYLFLLCVETLSSLLFKVENKGFVTGVPTSPRGPRLSHLFFADDSLLFCKANSVEWRRLIKILGVYEAGSGQKLNLQKTPLFFNRNTSIARKQEIVQLSRISEASRLDTYLGVLAWIGKNKGQAFKEIVKRV
jgi:ribosome-associated protein YbcJ (S4-like RNA binding protein)